MELVISPQQHSPWETQITSEGQSCNIPDPNILASGEPGKTPKRSQSDYLFRKFVKRKKNQPNRGGQQGFQIILQTGRHLLSYSYC